MKKSSNKPVNTKPAPIPAQGVLGPNNSLSHGGTTTQGTSNPQNVSLPTAVKQ